MWNAFYELIVLALLRCLLLFDRVCVCLYACKILNETFHNSFDKLICRNILRYFFDHTTHTATRHLRFTHFN